MCMLYLLRQTNQITKTKETRIMKFQIFKLTPVTHARQRVGFILVSIGSYDTITEAEENLNQLSDPSEPQQYTLLPIYTR